MLKFAWVLLWALKFEWLNIGGLTEYMNCEMRYIQYESLHVPVCVAMKNAVTLRFSTCFKIEDV